MQWTDLKGQVFRTIPKGDDEYQGKRKFKKKVRKIKNLKLYIFV
jgi:hypothetical protein